jgi:hypothetical protein
MRILIFLFVLPEEHEVLIRLIGAKAAQAAQAEQEEMKFLLVRLVAFFE